MPGRLPPSVWGTACGGSRVNVGPGGHPAIAGIRRGSDIIKALALGADAVLIGRPLLWGLAVNGAVGGQRVLEILRSELDSAMAVVGVRHIGEIGRHLLYDTNH